MCKKINANSEDKLQHDNFLSDAAVNSLDFSLSTQQVKDLMQTVQQQNTQNETKILFIKELLADNRYPINSDIIARKLLEFSNVPLPELEPEV